MSRTTCALSTLLLLAFAVPGFAAEPPLPMSEQFRVNSFTPARQSRPTVAIGEDGRFVVVWRDYSGGEGAAGNLFGRRFDAAGVKLGGEFMINSLGPVYRLGSVALDAENDFVVVWHGYHDDSGSSVQARRYASDGSTLGGEFTVNTYTTGYQRDAEVETRDNGEFIVVWATESGLPEGDQPFIAGQRFDSNGQRLGGEFQVNASEASDVSRPKLDLGPGGEFVVAWKDFVPSPPEAPWVEGGSSQQAVARRFDSSGTALGGEIEVSTDPDTRQPNPDVAKLPNGDFVIAWNGQVQGDYGYTILMRRFDSLGNSLGGEFRVNPNDTISEPFPPAIATGKDGSFVIAWTPETDYKVRGRAFGADGTPLGDDYLLGTGPANSQFLVRLDGNASGEFIAGWTEFESELEGLETDIFAVRLETPFFADGFESGDTQEWDGGPPPPPSR